MKVQVLDDDGSVKYTFDSSAAVQAAMPSEGFKGLVEVALHDATQFLSSEHFVIASIKADIQDAVSRIETELGAHPAFTWAQTMLSNSAAHLEHYVKGIWTEPDQKVAAMFVRDVRGVILSVTPPPAA